MRQRDQITITLDKEIIESIDKKKGLINRSRYLEYLIKKQLERE